MTLLDQWEQRRRQVQLALSAGQIGADEAARELAHLNYRISRRPQILKRRNDRVAYRIAKALEHRATRLTAETCSNSRARSTE